MRSIKKVKNYTVVQANDLIRNKKDFSLWELRVFALLASQVRKDDDDFKTYKFRIKDIIDLFDSRSNNLYDELRAVPERLHSKIIRIPYYDADGKPRTRRYNLVSMSDVPESTEMDNGEYIMLRFDKDLKPLLLQLGEHFTIYKFYNILKLRSTYVFQLYELLKSHQYKGRGVVELALSEIIETLQLPASYKYGNIRQRVIEPAKEQFKQHTDICFEYQPLKGRGGKVLSIRFKIKENTPIQLLESAKESEPAPNALYEQVEAYVSESTFQQWLKNYKEEHVQAAIQYTLKKMKQGTTIENVGGYIATMLKQENIVDEVAKKAERQTKKRKKQEVAAQERTKLNEQINKLYRAKAIQEDAMITALCLEESDLEEKLLELAKSKRFSGYDESKSDAENLKDPMFLASYRNAARGLFSAQFAKLDQDYDTKIKELKRKLSMV